MSTRQRIFRLVSWVLRSRGFELVLLRKPENTENHVNLNIGAGKEHIDGFLSLDTFSPHYHGSREAFDNSYKEYDMRSGFPLPMDSNTVDNIYCSHVLEHVETVHVERFIREAHRVLKPRGVLRISCPDAKFLYEISKFGNEYWEWRRPLLSNGELYYNSSTGIRQLDFFLRETATRLCRLYRFQEPDVLELTQDELESLSYEEFRAVVKSALVQNPARPWEHVNPWDFDSLQDLALEAGFSQCFESKYQGSVSLQMQGSLFDRTAPMMSLYCEMVK